MWALTIALLLGAQSALAQNPKALHVLRGHWEGITDVAFSPNGRLVATTSDDSKVIVWNVRDGSQKFSSKINNGKGVTSSVAFSPDSRNIFVGHYDNNKGSILQFDIEKRKVKYVASLPGVVAVDYSPDGKSLLVAYINGGVPVNIINIKKAQKHKKKGRMLHLSGHTKMVTSAVFSPNGKLVLTTALDGNMVLWNAKTGERIYGLKADKYQTFDHAVFSPDGLNIASNQGSKIDILNTKTGNKVRTLVEGSDEDFKRYGLIFALAYNPDGKSIAVCSSNGNIYIWDVKTSALL